MEKVFIFGHCRNRLGTLLPQRTKDIMFLACTDVRTDFDESLSRTKRLYNNRQARNVFDTYTTTKTVTHRIICAMGKAKYRNQNFYGGIVGSGHSAYEVKSKVSAERKDFVGAFSLFFLSFSKLVTYSFPFVVFSFKLGQDLHS